MAKSAAAASATAAASEKTDAYAKFLVEEAKLDAEEQYIALSERDCHAEASFLAYREIATQRLL